MKQAITQVELNQDALAAVVADALALAANAKQNSRRWVNAIVRATVELESNPFMTFNHDSHSLLIMSSTSGETYEANGTCQCKAFEQGFPCWHRAAAKLVVNYLEKEKAPKTDKRTDAEFEAEMRRRKLEELLIIEGRAKTFNQAARIVARMTDPDVLSELRRLAPQI